jgi:hypothetical protein
VAAVLGALRDHTLRGGFDIDEKFGEAVGESTVEESPEEEAIFQRYNLLNAEEFAEVKSLLEAAKLLGAA